MQCDLNKWGSAGVHVSRNYNNLHLWWGRNIAATFEIREAIDRANKLVRVFRLADVGKSMAKAVT